MLTLFACKFLCNRLLSESIYLTNNGSQLWQIKAYWLKKTNYSIYHVPTLCFNRKHSKEGKKTAFVEPLYYKYKRKEKKRGHTSHHSGTYWCGPWQQLQYKTYGETETICDFMHLCIPKKGVKQHCENVLALFMRTSHLFYVIVQCDDAQRGREVGAPWDGGANRGRLTDEALVRGALEIWCLVVLIQNFNLQVSVCRKRVTVILLGLFTNKQTVKIL